VPSDKPWEDESLKGEYYKEKARMKKPAAFAVQPKAKATDAWGKAGQFTKRNQLIEEGTRRLRKALPGQGS
jgi:hypothetical protein